ncbi:ester cyclase [Rhodococcoides corynebacterioides]|uniref:ester cyclase n=1 Tax=Rhodococcoides corynebacterioides TaxID=53972 RepID=UPI003F7D067C
MTDARTVIDHHIDAFNNRTPETDPWADDAELVAPDGPFTGRDNVIAFLAAFQAAFGDATLSIDTAVTDGDRAAVEGTFAGTHDGPLHTPSGPVTATGKAVTFRWSAIYLVDAGAKLLRSEHLYFDRLDFLAQLGLVPN